MDFRQFGCCVAGSLIMLCGLGAPVRAAEPIPKMATIKPDPAVKRGVLPNGLRYAVMRNSSPRGAISIRLAMDVGSYDEADDERGIAHFVEHMAFRSTRQFPDGTLEKTFGPLGTAFGRDQNAATSLDSTVYRIDLPASAPNHLDSAFSWLRGVADGILFNEQDVARERGVVIAEKQAGHTVGQIIQEEIAAFQGPKLRSMNRFPDGTHESLRSISAAQLKSFYDRWYRPENAFLVIVGDASIDDLEAKAKSAFADWTGRGPAGTRAVPAAPEKARALDAYVRSEPNYPTAVSACRVSPPDTRPKHELKRLRESSLDQIWTSILNQRIARLATGKSTLLGGMALLNAELPDAKSACFLVLPIGDDWKAGLATGQAELRRFAENGPTEMEVETALESLRSAIRGAIAQSSTRSTADLANSIVTAESDDTVFATPREAMRAYNIAVDGVSPADVKAAFAADWSGNGPLLVAVAPKAPGRQDLIAAWNANQAAPAMEAYADKDEISWPYTDFGETGKVIRKEARTNPDYTHVEFANGTILNVKQTKFEEQGTEIRIRFGAGQSELPPNTLFATTLGAGLFTAGGLGKLPFEDVQRLFANTGWKFQLEIKPRNFTLSSSPLASQLPSQLELLAAYMSDPAFRADSIDPKLPTAVDMVYRVYRTEPEAVAMDAIGKVVSSEKMTIPPRATLAAMSSSEFARLLKPAITQAPLVISVVGDVEPQDVIDAVADSFGALPPRSAGPRKRPDAKFHAFPAAAPPKPLTGLHEGPADKAVGLLVWPLYVAVPERRREEFAIALAARVLDSRLRKRVREEMGKTYHPRVESEMPDHGDQGYLSAVVETVPPDLDQVVAAARASAAELAGGKISQEDLEAARQPFLALIEQQIAKNGPWAEALTGEEELAELVGAVPMLKSITLDDVRKAAATWLTREPIIGKALPGSKQTAAR